MQLRNVPAKRPDSILLYGFGLALALSLVFNGFLLYQQSHLQRMRASELSSTYQPIDSLVWQQELSECRRSNEQKDSLILRMAQAPNAPPGQVSSGRTIAVQQPPPSR
ncbi:hypothetical protein CLV58_12852 [Spirosoma oryzae]|uniref:Uncharacterized protein n=1 Tax=Spirosoma oryzae TaxID=1469603 RepID=A0A2T0S5E7_9BACT|nr:hypothetical protein [Spirosoma oryzae]PRY28635.1 hypothetical protein CLV58_12852 [Spirosoma oryzae]